MFVDSCQANGVLIDYIEPGKPNQNAFIERFNRGLRNEVLDLYLFRNLTEVREVVSRRGNNTTKIDRVMHWVACHRSSMRNETWKILVLKCRRNGEAYEHTDLWQDIQLGYEEPPSKSSRQPKKQESQAH